MLRGILMGATALIAVGGGVTAVAQPAPAGAPAAAAVDSRAVVAEIRRVLAANYVLPEMRPKLDAALAKGLAEGRYNVTDPVALAERINADLAATAHDKHLNFRYAPEQAARIASRPHQDDDAPPTPDEIRRAQAGNFGLVEMKVLPGNIRYLDMDGFVWAGPASMPAFDNAMRFLSGGDAVIIDLRHNGGGDPLAVQYLVSHFLPPDTPLVTFYMGANKVDRFKTLAQLPAGRMVGKPLYVLTSGRTASAAEEFTGHVAGYKLGELIGENTAGAGFRNDFFAIPGGFLLSVSIGRAVLASTGKDWEAVGFAPNSPVPLDTALDVARVHAMQKLALTAPPPEKRRLEAMAAVLSAKLNPVATALPLQAYAGTYGERIVRAENGALTWQRGNGPKVRMIAVGPNQFGFEEDPMTRIEFKGSASSIDSLDLVRPDGSRVTEARRP